MKDKIFNFLLVFSITFLIFSLFITPNKKEEVITEWVIMKSVSKSYTNPNAPVIEITAWAKEVSFDICSDIEFRQNWKVINIFEEWSCEETIIAPTEKYELDLSKEYNFFQDEWSYTAVLTLWEKDYWASFNIEYKWIINKLFTSIIYQPVFNLVAWFIENTNHSLGWGIILITLVIRLLLIMPQHKMMVSQRKMQKIQPKIKEIQEKYKWDNQKLWIELMALYKKEKVNPVGSCLPLLIQMPILIVVYHVLISIKEYENLSYLYSFLSNFSLESINHIFYWVDLLKNSNALWIVWILIALSVWIIQFIQIKLSFSYNKTPDTSIVLEKKKWEKDYSKPQSVMPSQEDMNKFMLYVMPIMITWFTFFFPAWLGLYWGIWTLFMIIQQFFVNKIVK